MPRRANSEADTRPAYDKYVPMDASRGHRAVDFSRQILTTCAPFFHSPISELEVLDIGCGYGHTAAELAKHCKRVVGIEPSTELASSAKDLQQALGLNNFTVRHQRLDESIESECYDLAILDNVLEHLPDHVHAFSMISRLLRPGGVVFILVPNRLWPIEVHYHLPFLSYLPIKFANIYLRVTGRGRDYTDASYAPTYWSLRKLFQRHPEIEFDFVLPADVSLAAGGDSWLYRYGIAAIRRWPWLWAISKAFLVVGVKRSTSVDSILPVHSA